MGSIQLQEILFRGSGGLADGKSTLVDDSPLNLKRLADKRRVMRDQIQLMIKRSHPNLTSEELRKCSNKRKLTVEGIKLGEVIDDRFRVEKLLDSGAMGNIYLVRDLNDSKIYAMKTLVEAVHSEKSVRRFIREAKALSQLHHKNIINVVDLGIDQGRPYYVMENLSSAIHGADSHSFSSLISDFHNQKVDLSTMLYYFADIAEGLHYLHTRRNPIIHRDLKPANILLSNERVRDKGPDRKLIKLVDFGVAGVAGSTKTTLTNIYGGEVVGTPHYMPITDWDERRINAKSDLYSLGIMMYLLVVGKLPYEINNDANKTASPLSDASQVLIDTPIAKDTPGSKSHGSGNLVIELLMKHRSEEPSFDEVFPGVDHKLIALTQSLMAKKQHDRPPNAQYVADELRSIAGQIRTKTPHFAVRSA